MGEPKKPDTKKCTVPASNGQLHFCVVLEHKPLVIEIRTGRAYVAWGLTGMGHKETAGVKRMSYVFVGSWLHGWSICQNSSKCKIKIHAFTVNFTSVKNKMKYNKKELWKSIWWEIFDISFKTCPISSCFTKDKGGRDTGKRFPACLQSLFQFCVHGRLSAFCG